MDIKYTSDKGSTYMYYFLYPIIIVVSFLFLYKIITYGSYGMFIYIMIAILAYAFLISFISLIKLRYIEVGDESIKIKSFLGEKIVEYKDIEHVYDVKAINGIHLIIWYFNKEKNKSKVIYVKPKPEKLPVSSYLLNKGELDITKFIKENSVKANPNYLHINKSSRWFLFGF